MALGDSVGDKTVKDLQTALSADLATIDGMVKGWIDHLFDRLEGLLDKYSVGITKKSVI